MQKTIEEILSKLEITQNANLRNDRIGQIRVTYYLVIGNKI